jgi:hypothetical protein
MEWMFEFEGFGGTEMGRVWTDCMEVGVNVVTRGWFGGRAFWYLCFICVFEW